MAKNQIKIKKKKITKSSKKRTLRLIKKLEKARLRRAFVRALHFRGKKPQGHCALHFALKYAFNNTDKNHSIFHRITYGLFGSLEREESGGEGE